VESNPGLEKTCGGLADERFKEVCRVARECACWVHHDEDLRKRMDEHSPEGYTYKTIWGCIAEMCRTGMTPQGLPLSIMCKADLSTDEFKRYCPEDTACTIDKEKGYIILCTGNGIGILHEMLHMCGIRGGFIEDINQGTWASYKVSTACFGHQWPDYLKPYEPPPEYVPLDPGLW
jgi:hypothetical protein